jgi:hypothetical protein
MATERCKQNGEKLPHEKTDDAGRKSERNSEEHETLKLTAREKSRTCNKSNSTTERDATKTEHSTKPTTKTTTREKEKIGIFRIAPNVELRGAALLRRPS